MNTWICFVSVTFFANSLFSQTVSRTEADSLLHLLERTPHAPNRMDLLLNLAQYYIFKPGELQADFDSALTYIEEANTINKSVNSAASKGYALLTTSYMLREQNNMLEGKRLAEEAVAILRTSGNDLYLAKALYELSMYFNWQHPLELRQRISWVEQAVNAYKRGGQLEKNAYILEMLGDLYGLNEESEKAVKVLEQALQVYHATKREQVQGIYVLLGEALFAIGRENEGLSYLLKALKTATLLKDSTNQLAQIHNYLGLFYVNIDREEKAVTHFQQALPVAMKNMDHGSVLSIAGNLAITWNFLNQPRQALQVLESIPGAFLKKASDGNKIFLWQAYLKSHTHLNQLKTAMPYCDTLLKSAVNPLTPDGIKSDIYTLVADYYFHTGQYSKARELTNKSLALIVKARLKRELMPAKELQYKLDSVDGNFQDAFRNFQLYKTLRDSLFARNREKQMQALGVEHELGMKEDSIKLKDKDIALLTQTNQLQQANLQRTSLIKNVTVAGIILSMIIAGLLYRQYMIKQKTSQIVSRKNALLEHLVSEKDWLLKEIHHRVKNNLQIVMSLLNSQSAYINNPHALGAIHDSQHRVQAMSLIHQKLYSGEDVSTVNMNNYIRDLVIYLSDSFDTSGRIRFEYHIDELEVDVSQAVPLGLILNEAITNALKYAFPKGRKGTIVISFSNKGPTNLVLQIADNGIGMDPLFGTKKNGSLGMSLMAGLSEDLNGHFSISCDHGTIITVIFAIGERIKPYLTKNAISLAR